MEKKGKEISIGNTRPGKNTRITKTEYRVHKKKTSGSRRRTQDQATKTTGIRNSIPRPQKTTVLLEGEPGR